MDVKSAALHKNNEINEKFWIRLQWEVLRQIGATKTEHCRTGSFITTTRSLRKCQGIGTLATITYELFANSQTINCTSWDTFAVLISVEMKHHCLDGQICMWATLSLITNSSHSYRNAAPGVTCLLRTIRKQTVILTTLCFKFSDPFSFQFPYIFQNKMKLMLEINVIHFLTFC